MNAANPSTASPQAFFGPRVLGVAVYSQLLSLGCSYNIFGLFIVPISEAFQISRGALGWGPSILFIMSTGLAPLLGAWADRGRVRPMLLAGSMLLAAGLCLIPLATQLWQMALLLALLVGVGAGLMGPVPCAAMVVNWYRRRRGFALGISAAGASLGGFLVPPTTAWLIARFGWEHSLLILGCVVAATAIPVFWCFAVQKPADVGQHPDGDPAPAAGNHGGSASAPTAPAFDTRQLLGNPNFWLIGLTIGLINGSGAFCVTYIVPFTSDLGYGAQLGSLLISTFAGCALGGKFLFGALSDRYNPRGLLFVIIGGYMIGWTMLFSFPSRTGLILAAVIAGLSAGGLIPVWNTLVAKIFGQDIFARVLGTMYLLTTPFILVVGPLGGYGFDHYGSYLPIMKAAWFVFPLMAAMTFFITLPRQDETPLPGAMPKAGAH